MNCAGLIAETGERENARGEWFSSITVGLGHGEIKQGAGPPRDLEFPEIEDCDTDSGAGG